MFPVVPIPLQSLSFLSMTKTKEKAINLLAVDQGEGLLPTKIDHEWNVSSSTWISQQIFLNSTSLLPHQDKLIRSKTQFEQRNRVTEGRGRPCSVFSPPTVRGSNLPIHWTDCCEPSMRCGPTSMAPSGQEWTILSRINSLPSQNGEKYWKENHCLVGVDAFKDDHRLRWWTRSLKMLLRGQQFGTCLQRWCWWLHYGSDQPCHWSSDASTSSPNSTAVQSGWPSSEN